MKRYLLVSIVVALTACASSPRLSDAERYALYREHAGQPIKSFHYFGNINGWTPLGDRALLIWTRPSQAYLLDLSGPCWDLDFAPAITVTNLMGEVSARFDKVIVRGGRGGRSIRVPCYISQIREVNVKAVRQAERDRREAATADRTASSAVLPRQACLVPPRPIA